MSGSEKCLGEIWRLDEEDKEDDKASKSVPVPMKSDWTLSLRRPGCGRLCTSVKTPGGKRSVQGMMGYLRCSWFLEDTDAGEVGQLQFVVEVNRGDLSELEGLQVCSTALILPAREQPAPPLSLMASPVASPHLPCPNWGSGHLTDSLN